MYWVLIKVIRGAQSMTTNGDAFTEWHVHLTISRFERRFSNSSSMYVCPHLEKSGQMLCKYMILQESPKKKIARHHVAGPCQPLYGTMPLNPFTESCIKILVDDELIMGWYTRVHFNCLNTNTMTLNTVVHDCMSPTNICLQGTYVSDECILKTILNKCLPHFIVSPLLDNVAEVIPHPVL